MYSTHCSVLMCCSVGQTASKLFVISFPLRFFMLNIFGWEDSQYIIMLGLSRLRLLLVSLQEHVRCDKLD